MSTKMLEPALVYREKLLSLFANEIYTYDYFLYTGYPHYFDLPKIETAQNIYQWAITDGGKVIGYFAYNYDPLTDCVSHFGLYSFDRGNPIIGYSVRRAMEELVSQHHRVEWHVIQGNPVVRHYDRFCARHHGNKITLHDAIKNPSG